MKKYFVSVTFSDLSESEVDEIVRQVTNMRRECALSIFEDVPEEN
jgi:hypothetical protein